MNKLVYLEWEAKQGLVANCFEPLWNKSTSDKSLDIGFLKMILRYQDKMQDWLKKCMFAHDTFSMFEVTYISIIRAN
jgi:hypothetical protein